MSNITDRNVIDLITMEDRNLVMIILDTLPWTFQTRASHRNALVSKVNDYLGYVYSGQVYEQRNKSDFDRIIIRVTAQYAFSRYALDLLDTIKSKCEAIDGEPRCLFEWTHGEKDEGTEVFDDGFSDDFIFDIEKIYPRIKKNWAKHPEKEVSLMGYEAPGGKLDAPMITVLDSYVVILMQDVGEGYLYLNYDQVPDDMDIHDLFDKAVENMLRDKTFRMQESRNKGIYGILAGGDFEAESLLLDWTNMSAELECDLLIAVPTKDMVLFTRKDDKKLKRTLNRMAREIFERNQKESPELLFSADLLEYRRLDGTLKVVGSFLP